MHPFTLGKSPPILPSHSWLIPDWGSIAPVNLKAVESRLVWTSTDPNLVFALIKFWIRSGQYVVEYHINTINQRYTFSMTDRRIPRIIRKWTTYAHLYIWLYLYIQFNFYIYKYIHINNHTRLYIYVYAYIHIRVNYFFTTIINYTYTYIDILFVTIFSTWYMTCEDLTTESPHSGFVTFSSGWAYWFLNKYHGDRFLKPVALYRY